jgi:enoyl-[acyl-carrier-protein] reductase (NADH)
LILSNCGKYGELTPTKADRTTPVFLDVDEIVEAEAAEVVEDGIIFEDVEDEVGKDIGVEQVLHERSTPSGGQVLDLREDYPVIYTEQEDYELTMTVSAYSLVRLARHALPRLNEGGSILTLTYLGAERVVPGYRIMGTAKAALESLTRELAAVVGQRGVRVNAISAGPIRTLAASGVPGFDQILGWMAHCAPLRRNVTQEDVAGAALFFASDRSRAITGQVLDVNVVSTWLCCQASRTLTLVAASF